MNSYGRNRGILHDDRDIVIHLLAEGLKRDVLLGLNRTTQSPGVLLREKPLRNEDVEVHAKAGGGYGDNQDKSLVPQDPAQRKIVRLQESIEGTFTQMIQATVLFGVERT